METIADRIRQLVERLRECDPPTKNRPASTYMKTVVNQINSLATTSPVEPRRFPGVWRKGSHLGEVWGSWHPNLEIDCTLTLKDGSTCRIEFLPRIAGAIPVVRVGPRGWAVFSHQQDNMEVHRQLWQDYFNCDLPSWVHVHHTGGSPSCSKKLDNRLCCLELRDQKEHGKEHGSEGGAVSRRGSSQASSSNAGPSMKRRRIS